MHAIANEIPMLMAQQAFDDRQFKQYSMNTDTVGQKLCTFALKIGKARKFTRWVRVSRH